MPDYTVKADVDSMLRADNDAGIRTAIGLGQTDAPTFLAQSLTGQSLTGTQATSLVDLAATWNTTGNPSLIYGRVTNINSGTTANLIDLGTLAGGSLFSVSKAGAVTAQSLNIIQTASANIFSTSAAALQTSGYLGVARAINLIDTAGISWSSTSTLLGATGTNLLQDAAGILAQRNGTSAQAFRVANSVGASPLVDYDRGVFDFKTTTNTLRIGTENGGTYTTARPIDFVTGGVRRGGINGAGQTDFAGSLTAAAVFYFGPSYNTLASSSAGVVKIANVAENDFNRLQLGGTTSAFPAIKRNGTGIDIRLADDSGPAPLTAGSIAAGGTLSLGSSSVVLKDAGSLVLQVLNSGQTAGVVLDAATDGVAKFRLRGNAALQRFKAN